LTGKTCSELRAANLAALAVTAAIAVHGVFEYLHVLSLGIVLGAVWALPEGEPKSRVNGLSIHGFD
jgi:hypothetical protein